MKKLLLALVAAFPLWAEPVKRPHLEVELVTTQQNLQPGQTLLAGLRFKVERGWHIYWRNPGDSGEAVRVEWVLPDGFQASPLLWPTPSQLPVPPLMNYGYEGEVILPVEILVPPTAGKPARLEAQVSWLVCEQECIPGEATLTTTLPFGTPAKASSWSAKLQAARKNLPQASAEWRAQATLNGEQWVFRFEGPTAKVRSAEFFPFSETLIQHAPPQATTFGDGSIEMRIPRSVYASPEVKWAPEDLAGILVLHGDKTQAVEIAPKLDAPKGQFWKALLLAFLGGLILNLMPCVFPVLCLKVLSFVEMSGAQRRKAVFHSGAYAVGILVSFWLLAGTLIALRAGGQALGWGFQLQSPLFLAALAFLLVAMALNLFGVFEFSGRWMGMGQSLAGKEGTAGAFFSGVLATVVATPCTAPFMGTAMGYALSQSALIALGVFTALGLGLAFPYVLFSQFPQLTQRLPRPGSWMIVFKQFMAFPLLVTAVWLLSVLTLQTSVPTAFLVIFNVVIFSMGLWALGLFTKRPRVQRVFAFVCIALALGWTARLLRNAQNTGVALSMEGWQPYTEYALNTARASGNPVFIDFTAAWCITCQVNEKVALEVPSVKERFNEKKVIRFKADWTNQDAAISKKLESFGRNGVPLYVLYPPGANSEARILPQILTPTLVLEALDSLK